MRRFIALFVIAPGLITAASDAAPVDFQLVKQDITVNHAARTAQFSLTFNQPPDFAGQSGQQPDSFQYEIDSNSTSLKKSFTAADVDAVIRGSEIAAGQGIPVRSNTGDGGLEAGGWGTVRAFLPFHMAGDTVQFTAPLADLDNTSGKFRFRAFSTHDGAITAQSVGAVVPVPPAVWQGAIVLVAIAATRRTRMVRRLA